MTKRERAVHAIASTQGGYFTAKQAKEVGCDYWHLHYHVSTGAFERVGQGLYRVASLPFTEHDDLIRLSLWSRDRQDEPQAVVSHESALALYELSDLLPTRVHLTVPPTFRKKPPPVCVLYKATLAADEVREHEGFRVTSPLRTLLDVTAAGTSQEELEKAADEALSRGMVRAAPLYEASQGDPRYERLRRYLAHRRATKG
jgi:predicted transcriptional regulator of viral defense system